MTANKYEFDSVRWLRKWSARKRFTLAGGRDPFAMCADEIAALRARVARLEEALKEISTLYWIDAPAPEEMRRIARRALEEK